MIRTTPHTHEPATSVLVRERVGESLTGVGTEYSATSAFDSAEDFSHGERPAGEDEHRQCRLPEVVAPKLP